MITDLELLVLVGAVVAMGIWLMLTKEPLLWRGRWWRLCAVYAGVQALALYGANQHMDATAVVLIIRWAVATAFVFVGPIALAWLLRWIWRGDKAKQ